MLTFTAQGRIEVYLNGVLISRHVQEREAIESISRHGGIGTYEVIYPKVLVRKVERVSRETFVETGYGYGSGMAVEVVRRIVDVTAPTVGAMTASGMTTTQVTLAWPTVSDTDFSYFELQKSTNGVNFGFLTTKITNTHTDTGLSAGSNYSYRYRIVDQSGNRSSFSAVISPIFPTVPTSLTVTGVTGSTITLDWADNPHSVSGYRVYRSTDGTNYSLIASPATSTYPDSSLSAGTTYYYKVSAVTAYGESAQSSAVSQTTTATGPEWIQNLPSITFTRGVTGQTFDFYPTYLNTNNSVNITVESGTLPSEIRIVSSPTPRLAYDGTGTGSISSQVSFRVSTTAQSDWQSRISGSGVVWYHDFSSDAEVSAFQWTGGVGNDPNDALYSGTRMRRITTDGITGACLEIFRPAGNSDGPVWWRPFSPFVGGGGKGVDDPAAGSTLRTWSPTQGGSQTASFAYGYYGAAANHGTGSFDGTEYYFQMRVKISASRWNTGNPDGGKLLYFSVTKQSYVNQELVTLSREFYSGNTSGENYFRMYRSGGSLGALDDSDPADNPANSEQPGGEFEGAVCQAVTGSGHSTGCWWFPQDQWVTLLYHVILGTNSGNDTTVRVWAARQNETTYTKIWDQDLIDMPYDAGLPFGHNACILTAYMNGAQQTMATDIYHRYCQVIFSKNFIPCPQV